MSEVVLDCRAVEIATTRTGQSVVKKVSFQLRRGEVLGLIGESGAGKTTLGLLALGHLRAGLTHLGGSLTFEGQDLLRLDAKARQRLRGRKIAYVAQSAAAGFNPAQTLYSQITEPLALMGVPRAEIDADLDPLLAALGLPVRTVLAGRYPHQLSGGQLQRAMIAMALLPKPALIVFDEPTTALDEDTQADVLAAIKQGIALSGAAVLYISHDLPLVMGLAHRVLVLRDGAVVEETDVATLRASGASSDYARRLLQAHVIPAARLPSERPAVLEVRGVTIAHPNGPVLLRDFGVTLHRGETVAVTGPSGSGKSSLLRAITGLMRPEAGEVLLNGERLAPMAQKRRKDQLAAVQIVHQIPDLALNPAQSVGFILGRGLRVAGVAPTEAALSALLAQVELSPALLNRRPADLSGGQKQRVCIARALAAQPKVLICDEPTASLDPLVAQEVLATLARIQEAHGTACLFITHDRALVASFAHREVALASALARAG